MTDRAMSIVSKNHLGHGKEECVVTGVKLHVTSLYSSYTTDYYPEGDTNDDGKWLLTQNLPAWIGWFHYLDFLHYAWASLMLNEFEHKNTIFIDNQTV